MNKKTANEQEVKKFSDMASEWWDPNGKFSPLHKFNPVRQEYLIDKKPFSKFRANKFPSAEKYKGNK